MDHTKLDRVLYKLKWYGPYQVTQLALILPAVLPGSLIILSYIFVGYDGPHTCTEVGNKTELAQFGVHVDNSSSVHYGECEIVIRTNYSDGILREQLGCVAGNTYLEQKQVSFVSDWDLVCDRASMSQTTQTLFVLGQAAGALFCSSISDRFGRKLTYIVNLSGLIVTGIILAFSPNFAVFATFRFVSGVCQQGTDLVIATMLLESVPTEKRFKIGTLGCCLWGMALVILAPMAYLLKDVSWRYLQLTVALTAVFAVILPFKLEDTLRWLMANGKTEEVDRILRKAAKMNKVPIEEVLKAYHNSSTVSENEDTKQGLLMKEELLLHQDGSRITIPPSNQEKNASSVSEENLEDRTFNDVDVLSGHKTGKNGYDSAFINSHGKQDLNKYTILDILRNKLIFKNALIIWYCWIVCSLVYYGLYMTSSTLTGSRYLDYFLNSVVEVPGSLLIFVTIERFGRKYPALLFNIIAGLNLLAAVLLRTFTRNHMAAQVIATILTLVGKLAISTAFGIMFIYTPELFPTNLRNVGLGAASFASRIGGVMAPFTSTLEKVAPWASGTLFAGMCLLAAFLIQFLPETRGHELPQTIGEIKEWYKAHAKRKKAHN